MGVVITLVIILLVVLGVFLFLWYKRNKRSRETRSLDIKHETQPTQGTPKNINTMNKTNIDSDSKQERIEMMSSLEPLD